MTAAATRRDVGAEYSTDSTLGDFQWLQVSRFQCQDHACRHTGKVDRHHWKSESPHQAAGEEFRPSFLSSFSRRRWGKAGGYSLLACQLPIIEDKPV